MCYRDGECRRAGDALGPPRSGSGGCGSCSLPPLRVSTLTTCCPDLSSANVRADGDIASRTARADLPGREGLNPVKAALAATNRAGLPAPPSRAARRRRVHRPVQRHRGRVGHRLDGAQARSSSPCPTPTPRSTRTSRAGTPWSSPPDAATSRTRSTTHSPSPASSAAPWTRALPDITEAMKLAAADAIAALVGRDAAAGYVIPSQFDERVAPAVAAAVAAQAPRRRRGPPLAPPTTPATHQPHWFHPSPSRG